MNIIQENLFLRRPPIDYVSPPVCPVFVTPSSGSGSSLTSAFTIPESCNLVSPTAFVGQNNILTWTPLPTSCQGGCQDSAASGDADCKTVELCYSVYRATNASNPNGSYDLIASCVPKLTTIMCTPGCYVAAAVDAHGVEIARGTPVCGNGSAPIKIAMPVVDGAVEYNLYHTSDPSNPSGMYQLVLSLYGGEAFELCATGCYRVGFITPDGATPLGNVVCVTVLCPPQVCSPGDIWNAASCSCVPIICPQQPCTPGLIWDFLHCDCVPCPVQPCLPSQIWDTTNCACVTCPVEPCPPGSCWNPSICACSGAPGAGWSNATIIAPWAIYEGVPPLPPGTFGITGGYTGNSSLTGSLFMTGAAGFNNLFGEIQFSVINPGGVGNSATMIWNYTATGPSNLGIAVSQGGCLIGTGTCGIMVPNTPGSYSVSFPLPSSPGIITVDFKLEIEGPAASNVANLSFSFNNNCH